MAADVSEVDRLAKDLAVSAAKASALAYAAVKKTGHDIKETAKETAPVDKGDLRRSIKVRSTKKVGIPEALVSATAPHSHFQEFGTAFQAPQPFMGPAADRHEPEFVKAMEAIVGDI